MRKITIALGIVLTLLLNQCTDKEGATKTLRVYGFKPITVGGYRLFGGEDRIRTDFVAVSPSGDTVTGYVSRGVLKGATIRLDN